MATLNVYQTYNGSNMGFFGYSKGNTTNGYYNVTFNYDSVTRSGNTITVTNAYVKMANPNNGYTTNYVGVTNVVVGGVDLGISVKEQGNKSKHSCSTGKKTFSFNVSGVSTNTATVSVRMCYYAASAPNYEKPDRVQTLTGTLSFGYGTLTVTFNANGGNTPSPTSKTVTYNSTYGTLATCTRPNANNYSYTFNGWYSSASGGTKYTSSSKVTATSNHSLFAHWTSTLLTSACTAPTVEINTGNDQFSIKTTAGSDGVGNAVSSIELFVTIDGTTPSTTNFQFHATKSCSAGGNTYSYFYLDKWPQSAIDYYFDTIGTSQSCTIKAVARTRGAAGSSFYSGLSTVSTATFDYVGRSNNGVKITCPPPSGLVCGCDDSYLTVTWEDDDLNTLEYLVELYDIDTRSGQQLSFTYEPYYSFCTGDYLTSGHSYNLIIHKYDNTHNFVNYTTSVGEITVKNITRFTTPEVEILPCSFPNTKPYWRRNEDRMLYMNNGSGNLCKLTWPRAIASNNELKGYEVHIDVFDNNSSGVITTLAEFIGDVNEYYIKADKLASAVKSFEETNSTGGKEYKYFECRVNIIAKSAYGEVYDSGLVEAQALRFYFINGNGMYVRAGKSAGRPIMKRAVAFINNGAGWQFAYDVGKKSDNGAWLHGDTRYEAITNKHGELVLDLETDEPIYTY